jgi:hypothetical protein
MKKLGRFIRIVIATSVALAAILIALWLPGCVTRRKICDPVHRPSTDAKNPDGPPVICDPVHRGPKICDPVHTGPKVSPPDQSKPQK